MSTISKLGADMTDELLPCPFCGEEEPDLYFVTGTDFCWKVKCRECGASRVDASLGKGSQDMRCRARAIEKWNRRALLARQPAAIDKEAVTPMPATDDRRPYDESQPDGYLESDNEWIGRNLEAVRWFADNHAAIRAALANEASKPAPSVEQDERAAFCKWVMSKGAAWWANVYPEQAAEFAWMKRAASTSANVAQNERPAFRAIASALLHIDVRGVSIGDKAIIQAAIDALNSANVAQGWKLVPIEPTNAMTFIGQKHRYDSAWSIGAIYHEMLAAAPSANVAQGAEAVPIGYGKKTQLDAIADNGSALLYAVACPDEDWNVPVFLAAPPAQTALTDAARDAALWRYLAQHAVIVDASVEGMVSFTVAKDADTGAAQDAAARAIDMLAAQSASGDTK
jgi:hypothetical protein